MKRLSKFLLLLAGFLLFTFASQAVAVPININYTTDNVTVYFATMEWPGVPIYSPQLIGENSANWQRADSTTVELEAGHSLALMFVGQNVGRPGPGNPGGFLADVVIGDTVHSTSDEWFVSEGNFFQEYIPSASWEYATSYGRNDDPNTIWYGVNNGPVAGISGDAEWIWTQDNFANSPDFVSITTMVTAAPVPEPATMMLLGVGLVGIAGLGRKKLFKK